MADPPGFALGFAPACGAVDLADLDAMPPGKGVPMKRLIINADDFGQDDDTCDTTIALLESGT